MYFELRIITNKNLEEDISTFLIIEDIDELIIEDPQTIIDKECEDSPSWDYLDKGEISYNHKEIWYRICVDLNSEKEAIGLKERLQNFINDNNLDIISLDVNSFDPDEYKDNYKKYFKAFSISDNIIICPSWEECESSTKKVIHIDPSGAFGTGTHETTSMCAKLIEKYLSNHKKIADIGTGSAILSLIAASLGAKDIKAYEICENAVNIARENVIKNKFQKEISIINKSFEKGDTFDMIISNITVDVLSLLYDAIEKSTKKSSVIILSGILDEKYDEFISLYSNGFELIEKKVERDWVAVAMRKK